VSAGILGVIFTDVVNRSEMMYGFWVDYSEVGAKEKRSFSMDIWKV
jgi:hypothetical protein